MFVLAHLGDPNKPHQCYSTVKQLSVKARGAALPIGRALNVVTISLCVCVYVHFGEPYGPDPGGVGTTFSKMGAK